MTKSELIMRLAMQNPHLVHREAERIVNTIFETIAAALARGERIELRGFGSFVVKERAPRVGRNPAYRRSGTGGSEVPPLLQERQGATQTDQRHVGECDFVLETIGDGRRSNMQPVSVLGSNLDDQIGRHKGALEARQVPPTCPTQ